MKKLACMIAGAALGLCVALVPSGSQAAEHEVVTITGQVVLEEQDEAGDLVVTIVTETDTYLVHEQSKASGLDAHGGKKVTAKGTVEVTEVSKTISVEEFALIEDDQPPVGVQ